MHRQKSTIAQESRQSINYLQNKSVWEKTQKLRNPTKSWY